MSTELAITLIKVGGFYNIGFAFFHLFFWNLFNWKNDLRSLTFINRAIMQVLNLSLTFAFVIFGVISIAFASDLAGSSLGHAFLVLLFLFWFVRGIEQVVFFKLKYWRSRAFLVLFLIGAAIYGVPAVVAH